MRRLMACASLALALAGPASAGDAPDFAATAHTVAIVSLLGDTINVGDAVLPAPDGGFDDLVEHAMARQIAADIPGAGVVRVGGARGALLEQMYPDHGFGDVGMDQVRAALTDWAASHHVDYIVILRKTFGTIERREAGYSMTMRYDTFGMGFLAGAPNAFLNVTVCDGKTLKVVAGLSARDQNWGSQAYQYKNLRGQMPAFIGDVRAMLDGVVPGLVHGVGL